MVVPPRFVFQRLSLFRYDDPQRTLLFAGRIEVSECIVQTVDHTSRPEFVFAQAVVLPPMIRK